MTVDNSGATVAVLGARGFIGSAVVRALSGSPGRVIAVTHRHVGDGGRAADVRDSTALQRALVGADVIVHSASYVGAEEEQAWETNVRGTENVAAACDGRRVIYISTAAVYGAGPFRETGEDAVPLRPRSARSETRRKAEQIVLGAGGTVLRPHLVLGEGDRWVGNGIRNVLRFLPATELNLDALHTVVDAAALGAVAARIARSEEAIMPGVFHVGQSAPVSLGELIGHVVGQRGESAQPVTDSPAPVDESSLPSSVRAACELLRTDHHFSTHRLETSYGPVDGDFRTAASAAWYRGQA